MKTWLSKLLIVLCVSTLAGCGDLPRPFEGAGREGDPSLLEIRDSGSVRVEISDNLPKGAAVRLARAMVHALQKRDIPAYSDVQKGGSFIVRPTIISHTIANGQVTLEISWVLMRPDGLAIDKALDKGQLSLTALHADVPSGPEENALPLPDDLAKKVSKFKKQQVDPVARSYDMLVSPAADKLAFLISGDRSKIHAAPVMKVALMDFSGAPGDGDGALLRSASAFLKARGISVDSVHSDKDSVILSATIDVTPVTQKTKIPLDRVVIEWVIMDPDGKELGQMKQNNVVPRGSLDPHWGSVASLAAQAAVDALANALEQIATDKGMILKSGNESQG